MSAVNEFAVVIPQAAEATEIKLSPHQEELISQVNRATVWDDESLARATDLAKFIRVALKNAEEERKKIANPINQGLKALNDRFKRFTLPLMSAQKILDKKIIEFQETERVRLQQEAANARAALEIHEPDPRPNSPEDLGFGEPEPAPAPKAPALRSRGDYSTSSIVDRWRFEVEDLSQLPDKFCMRVANDQMIQAAVDAGERSIPGLRIFNDPYVRVR